jgi:hypothetical protein
VTVMNGRLRLTTAICFVVGFPTVIMLMIYVILFLLSIYRNPTREHFIVLLYVWQTQVGAAFAVAAAMIGAAAIIEQTAANKSQEDLRRSRRAVALRAVLPIILSELVDYTNQCLSIYLGLLAVQIAQASRSGSTFPSLPSTFSDRLIELIEASQQDHAAPLIALLRRAQIQQARAKDVEGRTMGRIGHLLMPGNLEGGLIDTSEIHARCGKLFLYARGESELPASDIFATDVKSSLQVLTITQQNAPNLDSQIDRRQATVPPGAPWPEL